MLFKGKINESTTFMVTLSSLILKWDELLCKFLSTSPFPKLSKVHSQSTIMTEKALECVNFAFQRYMPKSQTFPYPTTSTRISCKENIRSKLWTIWRIGRAPENLYDKRKTTWKVANYFDGTLLRHIISHIKLATPNWMQLMKADEIFILKISLKCQTEIREHLMKTPQIHTNNQ